MKRSALRVGVTVTFVFALAGSALAAPGATVWTKRYDGAASGDDRANSVAVSPDGATVFVTGSSAGSTTADDYATIAYDSANGTRLWARRYNGPGNSYDYADSLAVSPDGATVFVTGGSAGSTTGDDYATIAYDSATGTRLWAKRYNGPGNSYDYPGSLAVSPDGATVFVTGSSAGSSTGGDFATIAYDASSGARVWTKRYNGPANSSDGANSLAVSPDGSSVFVTGTSFVSGSDSDYATVAYDASSGAKLWTRRYVGFGSGYDEAYSVAVSPDGTIVIVTGGSPGDPTGDRRQDYATVAYSASTGAGVWTKRYSGLGTGRDYAQSVVVSPDGATAFVTGQSVYDYATIAYDASTGADVWTRRYSGPGSGEDGASSAAVSSDGTTLFVTGWSAGYMTGLDYATIAYDASTGADVWIRRYGVPGGGDDAGLSMAVSPDGATVFVTGVSTGTTTGYDYATIAYGAGP
jgi:outer membrane protein assembly factor BamB